MPVHRRAAKDLWSSASLCGTIVSAWCCGNQKQIQDRNRIIWTKITGCYQTVLRDRSCTESNTKRTRINRSSLDTNRENYLPFEITLSRLNLSVDRCVKVPGSARTICPVRKKRAPQCPFVLVVFFYHDCGLCLVSPGSGCPAL